MGWKKLRGMAVLAAVLGVVAYQFVTQTGGPVASSPKAPPAAAAPSAAAVLRETLAKSSARINQRLPMMVDNETELTGTALLDREINYNFRLVNMVSAEVDVAEFMPRLKAKVAHDTCIARATRDAMKGGFTFNYVYLDKNRAPFGRFKLALADCPP